MASFIRKKSFWVRGGIVALLALSASSVFAARIADIKNTKHNFSATLAPGLPGGQSRIVSATTEGQICVFCHTPHGADVTAPGPLWNRKLSTAVYDTYRSGSLDSVGPGQSLGQPTGISKLCLSCHDGTMAIGAVNVLNGKFTDQNPLTEDIRMTGTDPGGTMASAAGATSGFTRRIGTNLTNDHPISMVFDSALASRDGEMRDPALSSPTLGNRTRRNRPTLPLENNMVQ